ncbi:MAG TPA: metallophosphoesterase [Gemmatimonadaceae bacterium]|nr:metallophosphoesterase [Gemmatimonadaceae bacterium]
MRVGLMSDSHDRIPAIAEFLRQMQDAGIGLVLHAGDFCAPFSLDPFEEAHISMAGVFGKNDADLESLRTRAGRAIGLELFESPHSFEIGGRRILLVHDIADIPDHSIESHEIVVHGHSHKQEMKTRGETLLVNPGEACGWVNGIPTAAILDLDARRVEFLTLSGPQWKF